MIHLSTGDRKPFHAEETIRTGWPNRSFWILHCLGRSGGRTSLVGRFGSMALHCVSRLGRRGRAAWFRRSFRCVCIRSRLAEGKSHIVFLPLMRRRVGYWDVGGHGYVRLVADGDSFALSFAAGHDGLLVVEDGGERRTPVKRKRGGGHHPRAV